MSAAAPLVPRWRERLHSTGVFGHRGGVPQSTFWATAPQHPCDRQQQADWNDQQDVHRHPSL